MKSEYDIQLQRLLGVASSPFGLILLADILLQNVIQIVIINNKA